MPGQTLPGALIGAGVGIGLTVASKLITGLFFRRGKRTSRKPTHKQEVVIDSVASTPKAGKKQQMAFGSPAFGSPTSFDNDVSLLVSASNEPSKRP